MPECVHPPTRGLTTVLLMLWAGLALFTMQAEAGTSNECEAGWSYYQNSCYKMFEERETFNDADSTCRLFGAEIARGNQKKDFEYLNSLISKTTDFGFWYGAQIFSRDEMGSKGPFDVYIKSDIDSGYNTESKDFYGKTIPIPPMAVEETPTNAMCVGLSFNTDYYEPYMIPVECNTTLPYACRGGLDTAPKKTDSNYLVTKTDVFWVSSAVDRKNFNDASKACIAKAMTLASFRTRNQTLNVQDLMNARSLNNAEPWWIGLQMMNGVGTWTSGISLNKSVPVWTPQGYSYYTPSNYMLLREMTLFNTPGHFRAPFLCYKFARQSGQYGCPHTWLRAGQSCYRKTAGTNYVTREKGVALCNKMGSHLVSLDTPMEKLWFTDAMVESYDSLWTSLNDKQTQGTFVWGDGSKPKPAVVQWKQSMDGYGDCYYFDPYSGDVISGDCENMNLPGCQYKSKNGKCVSKYWSYLDGNCYYTRKYDYTDGETVNQKEMLHVCYDDLVKYDSTIKLQKLILANEDVKKLYKKANHFEAVWTGLKKVRGTLLWPDNTKASIDILTSRKQPDPGTNDAPKRCSLVDQQGFFTTESCDDCQCGIAVCEKEIAYHPAGVQAQAQGQKGASTNVQPGFGTKLLAVLTAVVLVTGFLA